jgi:hypothetical protein
MQPVADGDGQRGERFLVAVLRAGHKLGIHAPSVRPRRMSVPAAP